MVKTFEHAVTGFNHNIKHQGKIFHVQTEDSGVSNPHIITHLFVGGNILASLKASYAEEVGAENLQRRVRELMEAQHKQMLRNLIHGMYDDRHADVQSFQPGEIHTDVPPPAAPPQREAHREPGTVPAESENTDLSLDAVLIKYLGGRSC